MDCSIVDQHIRSRYLTCGYISLVVDISLPLTFNSKMAPSIRPRACMLLNSAARLLRSYMKHRRLGLTEAKRLWTNKFVCSSRHAANVDMATVSSRRSRHRFLCSCLKMLGNQLSCRLVEQLQYLRPSCLLFSCLTTLQVSKFGCLTGVKTNHFIFMTHPERP